MSIPEDPFMLLSFVNMKLRDGDFASLSELCDSMGCDEKTLIDKLHQIGFDYIPELKQFK